MERRIPPLMEISPPQQMELGAIVLVAQVLQPAFMQIIQSIDQESQLMRTERGGVLTSRGKR